MTIQWFPGHMAKARRQIEEKLNLVDLVMELVDARAPISSQNPMLQQVIKDKPKLVVLMKRDLADKKETVKWVDHFEKSGIQALAVNVNDKSDIEQTIQIAKEIGKKNLENLVRRGAKPRPIRAMIIGIPNVGKSTLINRFANQKVARIGDRPGITKHQLWIKLNKDFELLDTPGVLWPKFEDQEVGIKLASIGTIKDQLLSLQDVTAYLIKYLQEHYPHLLEERYGLDADAEDMWDIFEMIGRKRGALESGGHVNFDKVAEIVLGDLRTGRLGQITLESTNNL